VGGSIPLFSGGVLISLTHTHTHKHTDTDTHTAFVP